MAVQQRKKKEGRKSDKNAPSVPQVDASLDKPLDIDAPPTIYSVNLEPEYGTAALNLSADFIRQEQALANKYLFFHPVILVVLTIGLLIYLTPRIVFPIRNTGSVAGWFYQLARINKKVVLSGLVFTAIGASFLFTLLSRVSDSYFKSKINQLVGSKGEKVFGINLNDLVARHETKDPVVNNTHIIVYRETPIALISLAPNMTLSTDENLVMSVTTVGCRRVYVKSGIIEDLIDWAMLHSKNIRSSGKYGETMKLLIDVYSFDSTLKEILKKKGFTYIQSIRVSENRLLGGLFGVKKELWGLQFHFKAEHKD
ncbi:HN1_G0006830.mRNA.1.CDS.1 [Saccharomyces cerevisiae]|nr:HN1_G0006830.mRNA.1.CDS.1 [Saccharomyces cerevisiae]CAI4526508.1 BAL_1a_G0028190.mRNA.1.CDS.1 [Saccharomyces cerevisiae]CAI7168657.1 BAL_1a_G0028190.mRNA.1.CDS.1 [Saccharomyces cerevisiae]